LAIGLALAIAPLPKAAVAPYLLGGLGLAAVLALQGRLKQGALGAADRAPLRVISRAGLSSKVGATLLEVDGERLLIVHGDAFAQLVPLLPEEPADLLSPEQPS
jgi:hypothetical protein